MSEKLLLENFCGGCLFLVGYEELLMVSTKPRAIGERRLATSNAV